MQRSFSKKAKTVIQPKMWSGIFLAPSSNKTPRRACNPRQLFMKRTMMTQSKLSTIPEGPMAHKYYPKPIESIVFSLDGPQPQMLYAEGQVKIIVVGLQAGQKIPVHPEGLALFQFLEGKGV